MKILTHNQIGELDKFTIEHESIQTIDLMERAARAIVKTIITLWSNSKRVAVFAGPGNNGGDALAVARLLAEKSYEVEVYLFNIHNHLSDECAKNKQRLTEAKTAVKFKEITLNFDPPQLGADTLVVDGLFGVGLNKPLSGGFASLVKYINQSQATVVSIDVPSGLMTEDNTYNIRANVIRATHTLTLDRPKLSMLFADTQPYLGRVHVLDIGLSKDYVEGVDTAYSTVEDDYVHSLMRPRSDFSHKGEMGSALMIAGSYGMAGAAVLATKACLRTGAGKVTTHSARLNYPVLQTAVPEAMMHSDKDEMMVTDTIDTTDFDAVAIGPGLGTNENTAVAVIGQIRRTSCPIVVDADAINIIGNHRAWMQQLPKDIIMTPHPKEFDRLSGSNSNSDFDRLAKARDMAEHYGFYLLLKGHHTALCSPDGKVIFNTTGNSGMATAGSGDVLTGIITGLLARGYQPQDAAIIGMYIHGLAGDIAAQRVGKESLIASDIISALPQAFAQVYR